MTYRKIVIEAGVTVVNVINIATKRSNINRYMTSQDDVHKPVRAVPVTDDNPFSCCKLEVTQVQLLYICNIACTMLNHLLLNFRY